MVDGLLAQVTDSMTYALTMGDSMRKCGIDPSERPVCVHVLMPHVGLFDDLLGLFVDAIDDEEDNDDYDLNLDKSDIDLAMRRKFFELGNMFPANRGFELVLIATNTILDTSNLGTVQSKLRP